MDLGLHGMRALVACGSRGIGLACATRLAAEGCRVAVHGRDGAALASAARRLGALAFAAELAEPEAVTEMAEAAIAALGGLDLLVVNTGHLPYGGFAAQDDDAWRHAFDLVVMSAVRLVRAALPALRRAEPGCAAILFIGSASTKEPGGLLLSNAMRGAVAGLAKSLAAELAPDRIRVNTLAPGYVASGRIARRMEEMAGQGVAEAEAARRIAGALPLGRLGRAEEIGDLAALLLSPRAAYVTGATLAADGGMGRAVF